MNKKYRQMIEQIKLDAEAYTDEEMKPVYKAQKAEMDALNAMVGALFIKYSVDGFLKMNLSQKDNIGIKETLKNIGKTLGEAEVKTVTNILGKAYADTYYKNAFIMENSFNVSLKFDILKKEYINSAVNQKLIGEMFSDRIWANKADMIDKLQNSLVDAMQGKTTIDKVARDIKNTFNVTAYQSQRLAQNENARVQSQAIDDIGRSTGVTQQLYSATLDNKTSSECSDDDGKIWDIDDPDKVIPPENHVGCRCCLINIPYEGWQATSRKDNETKEIIDYKDYGRWLADKGVD